LSSKIYINKIIIIKIIPGTRKKVTIKIFQIFSGTLILINDPIKFTTNINIIAMNNDLINHFINFTNLHPHILYGLVLSFMIG